MRTTVRGTLIHTKEAILTIKKKHLNNFKNSAPRFKVMNSYVLLDRGMNQIKYKQNVKIVSEKKQKNRNFVYSLINSNRRTSPLRVWKFAAEVQLKLYFEKDKQKIGQWMKEEIGNLGPAFIKLGQFISTRQAVFGKEISKELSKLQDDITPVESNIIKTSIEKSLGMSITDVFASFDDNCLGSASIGQVHRAVLKDKNNKTNQQKVW